MKKNIFYLSGIIIFFVTLSILLYGKSGNILIDFSRECYIPFQINEGGILGKDIFLIYGAFGYLFNAFLYKILPKIDILLVEGLIISCIISILFYFILLKFTSKKLSFIFTIFFITISVFSNSNFSLVMPYSYSTIWAVLGLYSVLFCELYKKDKLKYFLIGFITINKIELAILTLVLTLIIDLVQKKFKIKNFIFIFIIPLASILFYNPFKFPNNYNYLSKMINTKAISMLYKGLGSYFEINYFISNLKYLAGYILISFISYKIFKYNKFISLLTLVLFLFFVKSSPLFHLATLPGLFLSIINHRKIKKRDIILFGFCVILCSKAIFAIDYQSYSNFGFTLILFYNFRQLFLLLNKKWVFVHIIILFLTFTASQIIDYYFSYKTYNLKTNAGNIWLYKNDYNLFKKTMEFLDKNLKENEDMIVVPEGQIINLIYKKPWKYYNSTFTPLDFETFGEDRLIEQLKNNKTDYIIFYPRNTKEYGAKTICYDYAVDFCAYIMDNYTRVAIFDNQQKVLIFKINEK